MPVQLFKHPTHSPIVPRYRHTMGHENFVYKHKHDIQNMSLHTFDVIFQNHHSKNREITQYLTNNDYEFYL